MKGKRKDKYDNPDRHHKNKRKHKKKHESSNDSDSSDDEKQWVEASTSNVNTDKKKREKKSSRSSLSNSSKKKHKKKNESSSDSDSDNGEMQWVERPSFSDANINKKKKKHSKDKHSPSSSHSESSDQESKNKSLPDTAGKRDSWMDDESFVHTLSKDEMYVSSRQKRDEAAREKKEVEKKIQMERELNPHWKNEGTGLPEKETSADSLSLPSTSVGDGGYSWLKKAYYRIQEQAQQEGRSMEEVAVERWGSLSKLTSLIEEAEERMKNHPDWKHSKSHYKDKYYQDNRSSKIHFKKPSSSESERNFDTPFQFRKPSDDLKNRKSLNQFKSSRKTDDMSVKADDKSSDKSDASNKQHSSSCTEKDFDNKKYNSSSGAPAWKKPKYSENIDAPITMSHSDPHIPKTPLKEVKEIENLPHSYTLNDLNRLGARQYKAVMKNDTVLAERLMNQLIEARKVVKLNGYAKEPKKKVIEDVILTKYDSQGQAWPMQRTPRTSDYSKRSNKYSDDDSSYSLKQMFEREKRTTADDQIGMFMKASAQSNEKAELDHESGHISKQLSKTFSSARQEEREMGIAIQQHQRLSTALGNCKLCLYKPRMLTHLIVDIGETIYLAAPEFQCLVEGHCFIVPKNHVSSLLSLDENEWREINDFKYTLRSMFKSENKSVIFMETSMHFRYFPHAALECIPVPEEEGDMAPFYFKKAIQESETEWSHNKKLIDLTTKGLIRSVPKGLPYFYVEFDPKVHAGYAHVIEEEKYFPRNFGREVVGGMLGIEYNHLYKNKREDFLPKCKEVVAFEEKWSSFKTVK